MLKYIFLRKISDTTTKFFLFLILFCGITALPPIIKIGAIFTEDHRDSNSELAFKYAIYKINKDKNILPKTTLVYDIQYVPKDDSFRTSKKADVPTTKKATAATLMISPKNLQTALKELQDLLFKIKNWLKTRQITANEACRQLELGILAIFGPNDPLLGSHIQSICEALSVPHIEARVDYETTKKEFSVNLYPSQFHINKAYKDLIMFLNWTKVAILYEEDFEISGIIKQQELMKTTPISSAEMYIRQVTPETYRQVLKEIRQKEIYKLIVDTNSKHMNQFFRAILQLQMNDYRYHYMFTTFDIELFDLEDFKYNGVNITAFRLIDVENPKMPELLGEMKRIKLTGSNSINGNNTNLIQTEPALIFDSVYVFAAALSLLDTNNILVKSTNLSCDAEHPWIDGKIFYRYLNSIKIHGLTGMIEFNADGKRDNFRIDLLKLKREQLEKVGHWSPVNGINITDPNAFYETNATNITLIVMTREEKPYVMVKEDKNLTGNAIYEGFCIDLLKGIASQIGFQYQIRLVPDRMYGVYDPETKQWNGIVRELMERRADLAVASMTINYARESVIDFTKPFMNLGIGILFKKAEPLQNRFFSFLNPFAIDIWFYIAIAYVLVSLTIWIVARFSPFEWHIVQQLPTVNDDCHIHGEDDCDNDNLRYCYNSFNELVENEQNLLFDVRNFEQHQTSELVCVENNFTLRNSFWFTIGTLMQQGSDLNPKATSTRIVGGIWWFFTLIIISSYTANLAAFLTVERMITPIENAADLSEQTDIAYGTLAGGSTMTFFRDSKIGIYQKMWRFMESKKSTVFVNTYEEGIKRVLNGNYAFLMESTMLDYAVQRDCNLTQIGGLLDSKGYGIATPKGSPWRDKISLAILELQEKGVIQILYDKWWKNTGDVCNRDDKSKESKANALGVENIGGVFVVLLCGLALAILVAILEFCWNSKKNAQTDRQSLCSEMADELKFAVRCHGSRQRPALKRTCTKCSSGTTYVPGSIGMSHINGELLFQEPTMLPMMDVNKYNNET